MILLDKKVDVKWTATPKVGIRTHNIERHKKWIKDGISPRDHFFGLEYQVMTRGERERFYDALEMQDGAVRAGNAEDIGERPDGLCAACLNYDCGDSSLTLSGRIVRKKILFDLYGGETFRVLRTHGISGEKQAASFIEALSCRVEEELRKHEKGTKLPNELEI